MSSNIPKNFDRSDPQNLKVARIEPDIKYYIDIPFKGRAINSSTLTKLILFLSLNEKVEKFLNPSKKLLQIKDLFTLLIQLKIIFKTLMIKDTSQDYQFAEALSKNWHLIIENRQLQNDPLNKLIESIQTYPKNVDHPFGYYLNKITGEAWLPFPFIEILYSLHESAILNPQNSTLTTWIKQIDDILYANPTFP